MKLYAMPCVGCGVSQAVPFDVAMRIALGDSFVMCDSCARRYEGENERCEVCVALGLDHDQVG
jgi:hypothetical protein